MKKTITLAILLATFATTYSIGLSSASSPGLSVDSAMAQAEAADTSEEASESEPVDPDATTLSCGEETKPFDVPAGSRSTSASNNSKAAIAVAMAELYDEVGMGRPDCDSSNCGFGQSCPSKGGSQTTSGGISASQVGDTRFVDIEVKPGTQAIKTCSNCS